MPAANPPLAVLDQLVSDDTLAAFEHVETVQLTPHLVLAAALLYMMASDGQLEAEESSQLQAAIGGHEALLNFALRYVQQVPVEEFLAQAPEVLSAQDKLCILANVCDSMLADGRADPDELALFSQFLETFGLSESLFAPYFKTIALKNDKTVFGPFSGVLPNTTEITPHLALAASLLYMMSADGTIGAAEIGQLEAVIGEFAGLQQVALTYVRQVKRGAFLRDAAPVLTDAQKLCILTNVCDSMLSDGNVALMEDKLFVSMLEAFGYSENGFHIYYQAIETKNIKPFDTSQFKPRTKHSRLTGSASEEGEVFDQQRSRNADKLKVQAGAQDASPTRMDTRAAEDTAMGSIIHRTMQDNVNSVNQDFGHQDNVVKVGANATDQLNLQKANGEGAPAANIQAIASGVAAANVQSIAQEGLAADNRQTLALPTADANVQKLQSAQDLTNRQATPTDAAAAANRQAVPSEAVAQNRQAMPSAQTTANTQNIDTDVHATYGVSVGVEKQNDNVQSIPMDALLPNVQPLAEGAAIEDHLQAVPLNNWQDHAEVLPPQERLKNLFEDIDVLNRKLDDFEQKNKALLAIAKQAKLQARRQEEQALSHSDLNRQTVSTEAPVPNVQALENKAVRDNVQDVPVDGQGINVQEVPIDAMAVNRQKIPTGFEPAQIVLPPSAQSCTDAEADRTATVSVVSAVAKGGTATPDSGLPHEQAPTAPPAQPHTFARAPRRTRLKKNVHSTGDVQGRAIPYRVYVKATVTFVVLSCWASNIAAIDTWHQQRFTGLLERDTVSQMAREVAQPSND